MTLTLINKTLQLIMHIHTVWLHTHSSVVQKIPRTNGETHTNTDGLTTNGHGDSNPNPPDQPPKFVAMGCKVIQMTNSPLHHKEMGGGGERENKLTQHNSTPSPSLFNKKNTHHIITYTYTAIQTYLYTYCNKYTHTCTVNDLDLKPVHSTQWREIMTGTICHTL